MRNPVIDDDEIPQGSLSAEAEDNSSETIPLDDIVYGGDKAFLPNGCYTVQFTEVAVQTKKDNSGKYIQLGCEILLPASVKYGDKVIATAGRGFRLIQSLRSDIPNGVGKLVEFLKKFNKFNECVTNNQLDLKKVCAVLTGLTVEMSLSCRESKPKASMTEADRKAGKQPAILKDSSGKEISLGFEINVFDGLGAVVRLSSNKGYNLPPEGWTA